MPRSGPARTARLGVLSKPSLRSHAFSPSRESAWSASVTVSRAADPQGERPCPARLDAWETARSRFLQAPISNLIEHYAGNQPLRLVSRRAIFASITSDTGDHARDVRVPDDTASLRAELGRPNAKIGYPVREHSLAKVPALLIVG